MSLKNYFTRRTKPEQTTDAIYSFEYNNETINYTIVFSQRRRTIAIYKSSSKLEVKAPVGCSLDVIHKFVVSKGEWISKHTPASPVAKIEYTNGSKHLFLGESFTLNVELGARAMVELRDDVIYVRALRQESVEKALNNWYLYKAKNIIPSIISGDVISFATKYRKSPVSIEYKPVKTYWGQCSTSGLIRLNSELIRAKKEHIQYIICHELCHLVHHNHSKRFYDLLDEVCPDWKTRKNELSELVKLR